VTANLCSFSKLHDYLAAAFFMRGRMAGMGGKKISSAFLTTILGILIAGIGVIVLALMGRL
jgi:hypothetical protein